jgi:hypothetical protein
LRNHEYGTTRLPRDSNYLCLLDWWFTGVLIGERICVPLCDVPSLGLADNTMGCETSSLYLFSPESNDVSFIWRTGDLCWNSNKPVAGFEGRRHTTGFDECEQDRLAEQLTDNERTDEK